MSSRTSYTQFSMMVEFMEKNGDLSKPQSLPNGRQWCINKWKQLSDLLNSQGVGESRSEEKWRKVWSDLKNNTKRKWAKMNRSVQGTGGGPALKMCLTDLENRVLCIMGVQAAVGMPIAEVGFGMVEAVDERDTSMLSEPDTGGLIIIPSETSIIGDEDWNTPGSSKDTVPVPPMLRSNTPPVSETPQKSTTPPKSPTVPHRQATPLPLPQQHQRKRKHSGGVEEYFARCEANAREDNRERDRLFVDLERERIRQRDIELRQRDTELQLQAQWLELMKAALNVIDKYLNEKK